MQKLLEFKKMILITLGVFISLGSYSSERSVKVKEAVEYLSGCSNFIKFDNDNVYTGFGTYWTSAVKPREPKPLMMRFVPIDKISEYQVTTNDSVIDVIKYNRLNYILTYSGIEEWNLNTFQRSNILRTHNLDRPLMDEEHPRGFAQYKNSLIIAHGRLGISIVDVTTEKVVKMLPIATAQRPLESVVNDITVSGKFAYAVVDSYTLVGPHDKPAFRGLVVIDLDSQTVVAELDGLDPGASNISSDNNVAIVSFYGQPLWKYSLKSLHGSSLPQPLKRVWKFPIEGHPKGKASMDDKYYYTCYSRMPKPGEGPYFISMPAALDRRILILD